jgi:hypothetical protein
VACLCCTCCSECLGCLSMGFRTHVQIY